MKRSGSMYTGSSTWKLLCKELKAPDGFVSSDEVLRFDASYQGQDVQTVTLKSVKKNQPTTVEITNQMQQPV